MEDAFANAGPKTHPATREMLPDDPLELQGFEMDGDPELMLRLVVEEYARMGFSAADIVQLATNPHYQAFDGLRRFFGDEEIRRRIGAVVARCGVLRMRTVERDDDAAPLVQIEMPA